MAKEMIKWMIGKGKYKASFKEFAVVCYLNYNFMKAEEKMSVLPNVEKEEATRFYLGNYEYLCSKGLKMELSVLNSLLRYTVLPKGGNSDEIRMKYYVSIKSILDGVRVNWVDFIVEEIVLSKHTVKNALAYQPYSMALIRSKAYF